MAGFLLKTEQLTIGFNGSDLLCNLNLELQAGELTCLMGPNGIEIGRAHV